jgi:hypothetical protein
MGDSDAAARDRLAEEEKVVATGRYADITTTGDLDSAGAAWTYVMVTTLHVHWVPDIKRLGAVCSLDLDQVQTCTEVHWPAYKAAKTERLREAGRQALTRINSSTDEDAVETRKRRAVTARERMLEARRWERLNGSGFDVDRYEREVMPIILSLTPSALARITGLSANHGTQVRQRVRRLHPMHWQALIDFEADRRSARAH